jgi:long-chain acyl-CoA synthetase
MGINSVSDRGRNIFETFRAAALKHRDRPALRWKGPDGDDREVRYEQLLGWVEDVAVGLMALGVSKGDRVALFSDNRPEWLVADLALLALGAIDVPRGTDTAPEELGYIVGHSGSRAALVAEPKLAMGMKPAVAFEPQDELPTLEAVREQGAAASSDARLRFSDVWQSVTEEDVATIIYTSGTTGLPKGVTLTHGNILHNVRTAAAEMLFAAEDRFLAVLPAWHVYERTVEYCVLAAGACLCYSKPTPQALVQDLPHYRPTAMVAVPRVWLSLKRAIQRALGRLPWPKRALVRAALVVSGRWSLLHCIMVGGTAFAPKSPTRALAAMGWAALTPLAALLRATIIRNVRGTALGHSVKLLISGGAGLPRDVDLFFMALGLPICEGYGLTETSPIVSVRRPGQKRVGTVGQPLPEVEVRISSEGGDSLGPGQLGRVLVRGPLVMKGYYGDPEETARVIDSDGWLDTGDVGTLTRHGDLVITGRAREMIVLMGGENVHPQPLERRILESPLVAQVMVVGHGAKVLGALVVPDVQALQEAQPEMDLSPGWASRKDVNELFKRELAKAVGPECGLRPCERVTRVCLLEEPFRAGEELTHTLKLKRDFVLAKYRDRIKATLGISVP